MPRPRREPGAACAALADPRCPRGRAQRVLMRGMMADRAAHTGGQADLPQARGHAEALPTRLYPVNRVLRSSQVRTHRQNTQQRKRKREKTAPKRAERARLQAEKEAESEARTLARRARRLAREGQTPTWGRQQPAEERRGSQSQPSAVLTKAPPMGSACLTVQPTPARQEKRVPLLRLSRGRLQPLPRLVATDIRHQEVPGAACGADP
jgi:hypothetical protein